MKTILSTLSVVCLSFAFAATLTAQTVSVMETDSVSIEQTSSCTALTYDMRLGSRDARTGGQVTDLQAFLQGEGYLESDPTGYFGGLSKQAVQSFQKANGITPNGLVGPLTRAKIKALSCGQNSSTVSTTPVSQVYGAPTNNETSPVSTGDVKINVLSPVGGETYRVGQMIPFSWTVDNIEKVMPASGSGLWTGVYMENVATGKRVFLGDAMQPLKVGSSERIIPTSAEGVTTVPGDYRIRIYLYGSGEKAAGYSAIFKVNSAATSTLYESCDPITGACAAIAPGLSTQPSCTITSDKNSYVHGDKITFFYSSRNATYAAWLKDASGKDNLYVPGDKLLANGIYSVTANVVGNPSVTLGVYSATGSASCTKVVPVEYAGASATPTDYETASALKSYISPSSQNMSPSGKLTITWYSTNPKTGSKASLWLKNLSTGTLKLIASGLDVTGSYVWTLPAKGAVVTCPDCSGIQAELTAGSYSVVVKTYTPSNAWLGNGFPPANPTLPVYTAASETSPFTYAKTTTEPKVASYRGYMNGNLFIATNDISRDEALSNCMLNANSNPRSTIKCIWNDAEIYATPTPGTVSTTTLSVDRIAGQVAYSVTPNTQAVKLGSFVIQGPASGQAVLKNFYVALNATYPITNITNLIVKVGGSGIGIPIGNPKATGNQFSSSEITIPAGSSRTVDIYADIGGASSGSVTANLSASGSSSSGTYVVNAINGVSVSSVAAVLADPVLLSSSPLPQYVVGGTTYNIATFKLATTVAGTQATVRELRFSSTGADAIESITVSGVTAPMVAGVARITGLSTLISSTGVSIPVIVNFGGFQNSTSGGSLQTSIPNVGVTLNYVEATPSAGSVITKSASVASPLVTLVASKPTVTISTEKGNAILLNAENKIGEFTVSADANGKVGLSYASLSTSALGISNFQLSSARLTDRGTTVPGSQASISGKTVSLAFGSYEIPAGQSKTFSVYAVISGQSDGMTAPLLTSTLTPASFIWRDIVGGNTQQTGEKLYNFPTTVWSTVQGFPTMGDDAFSQYTIYKNNVVVESGNSSETTALALCKKYTSPTIHLKCTIGNKVIYESYPLPDYDFNPNPVTQNKFSSKCSVPASSGLAAGTEVCYGIWDYGDALGGDVDMCGGYSAATTGCVVSAPACASGKAEAVKYYSAPGMSQAVLEYAANNMKVTPTFLQQNMVMLWVYNCKADTSALNMSTASGQVLGASTMCIDLPFDFHRGNQSPSTKKLQDFLIKKGYMEGEVTGFYGDTTISAVKDYQKAKGLPETGMVYEFTRAALKKETCGV